MLPSVWKPLSPHLPGGSSSRRSQVKLVLVIFHPHSAHHVSPFISFTALLGISKYCISLFIWSLNTFFPIKCEFCEEKVISHLVSHSLFTLYQGIWHTVKTEYIPKIRIMNMNQVFTHLHAFKWFSHLNDLMLTIIQRVVCCYYPNCVDEVVSLEKLSSLPKVILLVSSRAGRLPHKVWFLSSSSYPLSSLISTIILMLVMNK